MFHPGHHSWASSLFCHELHTETPSETSTVRHAKYCVPSRHKFKEYIKTVSNLKYDDIRICYKNRHMDDGLCCQECCAPEENNEGGKKHVRFVDHVHGRNDASATTYSLNTDSCTTDNNNASVQYAIEANEAMLSTSNELDEPSTMSVSKIDEMSDSNGNDEYTCDNRLVSKQGDDRTIPVMQDSAEKTKSILKITSAKGEECNVPQSDGYPTYCEDVLGFCNIVVPSVNDDAEHQENSFNTEEVATADDKKCEKTDIHFNDDNQETCNEKNTPPKKSSSLDIKIVGDNYSGECIYGAHSPNSFNRAFMELSSQTNIFDEFQCFVTDIPQ